MKIIFSHFLKFIPKLVPYEFMSQENIFRSFLSLSNTFYSPPAFFCSCLFKQLSYPTAVDVLNHMLSIHSSRRAEN